MTDAERNPLKGRTGSICLPIPIIHGTAREGIAAVPHNLPILQRAVKSARANLGICSVSISRIIYLLQRRPRRRLYTATTVRHQRSNLLTGTIGRANDRSRALGNKSKATTEKTRRPRTDEGENMEGTPNVSETVRKTIRKQHTRILIRTRSFGTSQKLSNQYGT